MGKKGTEISETNQQIPEESPVDPDELSELREIVEDKKSIVRFISELFSGPIPHPKILAGYKEVLPDAPDRIISMAERQQEHRIGVEKEIIRSNIRRADKGLFFGFTIFLIFSIGSIILFCLNKTTEGYE